MDGHWDAERDERALVERAKADPSAFAELYRRYLPRVYAFAYRRTGAVEAAEDVTSAAFERALRNLGSFAWRPGGFGPWLFRIVANELVDHHRRNGRAASERSLAAVARLGADDPRDPADEVGDRDAAAGLLIAMDRLNPRYQRARPSLPGRPVGGRGGRGDGRLQGDARGRRAPGDPVAPPRARAGAREEPERVRERRRHRRLEEAGRRDAPEPDDAFADALEQRLLAVAASLQTTPPTPTPAGPPRAPRRRVALGWRLVGPGLVAAAGVVAIAIGLSRSGPVAVPELAAPVNVAVTLADGTRLEDLDGLLVPEGAVIVVGAGGSAKIGDTLLQPGDVATMEHGGLRVEHEGAVGSVTSTPVPTPRPTSARTPVPTRAPTPRPGRTPAPTAHGTPRPTGRPLLPRHRTIRTPRPPRPRSRSRRRPPAPRPPPRRTRTRAIVRPRLRARLLLDHARIAVTWTATFRARSYVLIVGAARGAPAPDPVYPGSRVIGTFARPPDLPLRFRVPPGVHAAEGPGHRAARGRLRAPGSNIVTITIPADATGPVRSPAPTASPSPSPSSSPTPTTGP